MTGVNAHFFTPLESIQFSSHFAVQTGHVAQGHLTACFMFVTQRRH